MGNPVEHSLDDMRAPGGLLNVVSRAMNGSGIANHGHPGEGDGGSPSGPGGTAKNPYVGASPMGGKETAFGRAERMKAAGGTTQSAEPYGPPAPNSGTFAGSTGTKEGVPVSGKEGEITATDKRMPRFSHTSTTEKGSSGLYVSGVPIEEAAKQGWGPLHDYPNVSPMNTLHSAENKDYYNEAKAALIKERAASGNKYLHGDAMNRNRIDDSAIMSKVQELHGTPDVEHRSVTDQISGKKIELAGDTNADTWNKTNPQDITAYKQQIAENTPVGAKIPFEGGGVKQVGPPYKNFAAGVPQATVDQLTGDQVKNPGENMAPKQEPKTP